MKTYEGIDDYMNDMPAETRAKLEEIRKIIQDAVPDAEEAIRYGMPTFRLNGKNMVHFAGFKHHIGFYATPHGHIKFEKELSKYKGGKGSVQFPLNEPMPIELIRDISQFRANQLRKGL